MRYAIITNGTVINVIESEEDFAKSIGAIKIPNDFGIGDKYVNGTWKCGEREMPEQSQIKPSNQTEVEPYNTTEIGLLKAQNKALSDRLDFTEDLIAEMGMIVYA